MILATMMTTRTTTNKRAASRTKTFAIDDFMRIQRSAHVGGAYWFWSQIDPLADPDMRSRARAVLRAMSERDFMDNGGVLVCLHHPIDLDPSLLELADLPIGWYAERNRIGDPWIRRRKPSETSE